MPNRKDTAIVALVLCCGLLVAGIAVLATSKGPDGLPDETETTCTCTAKYQLPRYDARSAEWCKVLSNEERPVRCPEWKVHLTCTVPELPGRELTWSKKFDYGDVNGVNEFEACMKFPSPPLTRLSWLINRRQMESALLYQHQTHRTQNAHR
jgi:hypothetical protein